jgi:predicted Zn-dependent protease
MAGCATNPATGEREISLIGEGQEIEMGRQADQQIAASLGLYGDADLQAYVQALGERLAAASERPDLPWTFRVVDDPTVNAFALPGGFIYVTRGIMAHLRSEAELAGVLGHEIGHVTARHTVSQMSRAQLTQLGVGLGMIFVPELRPFGDLASTGMQLLFLKYGRDDEREADGLGVRYMTRISYDAGELGDVMLMLERASEMEGNSGRVPEWLSTHPDPGNRATQIAAMVEESGPTANAIVRRDEYLRRLDGIVFGPNPREGIFEENVFRHPDLAFRYTFPRGWATANTKQAVQAMSPEQDAALQITLAQGSPSQALDAFASQGVQLGRTSQQSVHGLPAVLAEFRATTEQGAFVGNVLFVSHGGNTYQVLGYAPEARWSRNAAAIQQSLGSFQRETAAAILGMQPDRLDIVRVGSTLSFDAFLRRYPSKASPEVVALINGFSAGGTVQPGTLAKRVVAGS